MVVLLTGRDHAMAETWVKLHGYGKMHAARSWSSAKEARSSFYLKHDIARRHINIYAGYSFDDVTIIEGKHVMMILETRMQGRYYYNLFFRL